VTVRFFKRLAASELLIKVFCACRMAKLRHMVEESYCYAQCIFAEYLYTKCFMLGFIIPIVTVV